MLNYRVRLRSMWKKKHC